jgi:predicted nucleic acid-binding protein
MAKYIVADTSVVSHLTNVSTECTAYQELMGESRLAVSFQTRAELLSFPHRYGPARRQRLDDLLNVILLLPHSEATNVWYARVVEKRDSLRKAHQPGDGAQDADAWIISSALEHRLALMSHDAHQVCLGRAMGLPVLTNLDGLRESNPSGPT